MREGAFPPFCTNIKRLFISFIVVFLWLLWKLALTRHWMRVQAIEMESGGWGISKASA
jgi:hypothetical protein